jgi:hypothetical protein
VTGIDERFQWRRGKCAPHTEEDYPKGADRSGHFGITIELTLDHALNYGSVCGNVSAKRCSALFNQGED